MVSNLILSYSLPGKGGGAAECWGLSNGRKPEMVEQGDPLLLDGCSGDG